MSDAPAPDAMLSEMSACAYRLGMAFGRAAEATADWRRKIELAQLFDRCFFGVRVAIALTLRLQREARTPAPAQTPGLRTDVAEDLRERDRPETDGAETERPETTEGAPERLRLDADRDRETEGASLPLLLTTLRGVAADAAALPGPAQAGLPALTELLARVSRGAAPQAPARPAADLRTRLAGSAGAGVAPAPAIRPHALALLTRPATGPPRR